MEHAPTTLPSEVPAHILCGHPHPSSGADSSSQSEAANGSRTTSPLPAPVWAAPSALCLYEFDCLSSSTKWDHMVFVLL